MTNERTLLSQDEIARRIDALAETIAAAQPAPEIAVPVLAGAFVFAADLLRALSRRGRNLETEFVWLRSYDGERAGEIAVLKAPTQLVRGKVALLIDGVLDSGATLVRARELLAECGAAAVVSVVLVEKPHATRTFAADHVGFRVGPEFLYGYGMDRAGLGRGLPDVRVRTG